MDLDRLAAAGAPLRSDPEAIAEAARDRGGIASSAPSAVVSPESAGQVSAVMRIAAEEGWRLAVRGRGSSCGGQSLSPAPLVLDTGLMGEIEAPSSGSIWVGAGASWEEVSRALTARSVLPLPLPRAGSVGGGTSVASCGLGCQRWAVADRVDALEVVTGSGDIVQCSRRENSDLFDFALGGLGQFGVITRVRLVLQPVPGLLNSQLHGYSDVESLVDGLVMFADSEAVHVEGRCVPALLGRGVVAGSSVPLVQWQFVTETVSEQGVALQVPVTEGSGQELRLQQWLDPEPWLLAQPEVPGAAAGVQPRMDWFLRADVGIEFVEGLLAGIPAELMVGGRLLVQVVKQDRIPLLMQPEGDRLLRVGLHCGIPRSAAAGLLPLLTSISGVADSAGGKLHPGGWLGLEPFDWERHFGERWPEVCEAKRFYDPAGILNPGMIPPGQGS